jgi:hypothetical protein
LAFRLHFSARGFAAREFLPKSAPQPLVKQAVLEFANGGAQKSAFPLYRWHLFGGSEKSFRPKVRPETPPNRWRNTLFPEFGLGALSRAKTV